ncbi:MAG: hypothetical protein HZA54_04340 [Planctomycetes bacterium]|nr:hypothetical protein [Planctomycetota bacterium]
MKRTNSWTEQVSLGESPGPETLAELMRAFNDATERLQAAHGALERQAAELEQKNQELERNHRLALLGEMAACLAHEVRNPLGGLTLYVGLIEQTAGADPAVRELTGKLRSGVRHLGRVVEDILAYSGNVVPRHAPCDIHAVIEEALDLCDPQIAERGIAVERQYVSAPVALEADPEMLGRVFLNILLNAAEAIVGTGCIRIETRLERGERTPARVQVAIADDGPGLSAEALARLFTPFYTGRSKGTGLGLAIAHRIVEAHGGEISAENSAAGGARFVVTVPVTPRDA